MENKTEQSPAPEIRRDSPLDVLRMVAVLFVCLGHSYGAFHGIRTQTGWGYGFLQAQLVGGWNMGVDLFMLLTGMLYARRKWKVQSYARLAAQTAFYVVLIVGGWWLFTPEIPAWRLQEVLHGCLLPFPLVSSYWYLGAYTVVFFLIPYLNMLCRTLEPGQYRRMLCALFLLVCVAGAFSRDLIAGYGYNVLWMICMYLAGAYLALHPVPLRRRWLLCVAACCSMGMLGCAAARHVLQEGYWFTVLDAGSYSGPFMALGSAAVALLIARTPVRPAWLVRLVALLSPAALGVYLIQHPVLTDAYRALMQKAADAWQHPLWLPAAFAVALYATGSMVDLLRARLFALCGVNRLISRLFPAP